jgi:DNA-binding NarL/FixJ family response regulator
LFDHMRSALQAGASAFLPTTMRGTTLLRALQLILSGERYIPEAAVTEARVVARPTSRSDRGFPSLSHREREVLRLLVEGLPKKQIGQGLEIEVVTVAVHLRPIYRKLNVKRPHAGGPLGARIGLDGLGRPRPSPAHDWELKTPPCRQ